MTDRHFHQLTLTNKIQRTEHASTLELEVPEELKALYQFKAGQYLTFKTNVSGEEFRRSYSINSSSIGDDPLQVTVKKVKDGRVSTQFVDELNVGEKLDVMPPLGQFVLPEKIPAKSFFYAAGSGITPIYGLIKTVLRSNNSAQVNLQYGNFSREQVIFYDEFEQLKNDYPDRFELIHHFTDEKKIVRKNTLFKNIFAKSAPIKTNKDSQAGDFTAEKLIKMGKEHVDFLSANHFICGPGQMIPQLEAALLSVGVNQEHIHHEYFAAADVKPGSTTGESIANPNSAKDTTSLTVTLDGQTQTFLLPAGETVLRASIEQGLAVPYACEAGVCATCKALCKKGRVKLRSNSVLNDIDLEEGYILTCQAEACSDELEVDYDAI